MKRSFFLISIYLILTTAVVLVGSCGGGGGGGDSDNCTPISNRFVVTVNNGWNDTVYDTVTNITWIRNQMFFEPVSWSDYFGYDVTTDGFRYADALELIAAVNADNVGGYNDWSLPSIAALATFNSNLCDFPGPFLNFALDQADNYWSSNSEQVCGYGDCWYEQYTLYWGTQNVYLSLKGGRNYVWLSRY